MDRSHNIWGDWMFGSLFCDIPGGSGPSAGIHITSILGVRVAIFNTPSRTNIHPDHMNSFTIP